MQVPIACEVQWQASEICIVLQLWECLSGSATRVTERNERQGEETMKVQEIKGSQSPLEGAVVWCESVEGLITPSSHI